MQPATANEADDIRTAQDKGCSSAPICSVRPYYEDEFGVLYNADCEQHIEEVKYDVLLTDPPYFLPVNAYVGVRGEGYAKKMLGDMNVLRSYFRQMFRRFRAQMPANGSMYVFCDAKSYPIFFEVMFPHCAHVRLLIWDKMVSYNGYTWRHQHELIAWGELDETTRVPTGDGDILECRGVMQEDKLHPAQKPVPLLERIIKKHDGIFCDPYCGSGSTLVAAKMNGKKYVGFEMEEAHCETAARRLQGAWAATAKPELNLL
jgi:DNA modification methylase